MTIGPGSITRRPYVGLALALASGGDDYEIVACGPVALPGFTVVGEASAGQGIEVLVAGRPVDPGPGGWRHG